MVHVLLLLTKELGTDGVERVATEFVLSLHVLQNIDLESTV